MLSRRHLVLLSTVASFAANSAWAQASGEGSQVEEVVVTGVHASEARAVQLKANAQQIMDTVSASDIGQLPDFNAGDALKRVPGLSTLLYQGEPRFVIVRGLPESYGDLLIDGFSFASTDINIGPANGRQVNMELLPSNLASHIDVIKTATPSTDGNFIGGLTNFVTPSGFDFRDGTLSAAVSGGFAPQSASAGGTKPTGQATAAYAMQFGAAKEFALYLSATYWMRDINVPQLEAGGTRNWYTAAGTATSTPYGGTGFAVPSQRLFYNYVNNRDRLGLQARLDWHPTSNISGYVSSYHFHQDEYSNRNDLNAAVQASSADLGQTPTSGTLTNVSQTMQLGRYRWHRDMYGLYGRLFADLGQDWKLDAGSSWSLGVVSNPQTTDTFTQTNMAFSYDTSAFAPTFTAVNAAAASNYALYPLAQHGIQNFFLGENRFDEQLNVSYNSDAGDTGLGLKLGARYTGIFQHVRVDQVSWTANTPAPYTLASVASGTTLCGFGCNTPIPLIDANLADQLYQQNIAKLTVAPNVTGQQGGTYHSREQVAAGYVQAQYQGDGWLVIGGARLEGTFAGSTGTESIGGIYQPQTVNNQYVDVLPSIVGIYDTSDQSKLRFGISETVARAPFAASSVHGGVLNTTASTPTLSTGNPALKPRHAWNYDLNHDWYINDGRGIVSVGVFYKEIRDDIFSFGQMETVPGVGVPVLVTESRNTNHLVTDAGVEFNVSYNLDFLPAPLDGFGVSANATISHAKFPVTLSDGTLRYMPGLPEQPAHIYNASLFYDKDGFHGRFAWNHLGQLWDDRFPNFTPTGFYANRFQQPTDNFDIQVSYDVTSQVAVSVEAINITSQGMQYNYGQNHELYQSAWALPPEVMFGLKFKD
jgi:TonB-dependent receptor